MKNERNTENIVRKILADKGYANNDNVIIEEQSSKNPKIDKLLKGASKSGTGKGRPEFIITFKDNPDNIVVIECKAETSKHESKDGKQYKDYAVDGVLLYAAHLKNDFNVVAIAVSGEIEREIKTSHFLWLKGKAAQLDISTKSILTPKSLFQTVKKHSEPLGEEELIKYSIKYNNQLDSYSIPEGERCTVISLILVALQNDAFKDSYKKYHNENEADDYNPNDDFIDALLTACEIILKKNRIDQSKRKIILLQYEQIKIYPKFSNKYITKDRVQTRNRILRDLINDLHKDIIPFIDEGTYDVLGKFYTQFIRYAGGDKRTGLVLTPSHITDFFCEIAEVNETDIIFDPCCGTGGFLVSAMNYMLHKSGHDSGKHDKIKSDQLIGIEQRADMFSHACSNMMMRGDGKSNIHHGSCFDDALIKIAKKGKPNKAFLNPPYGRRGGESEQLEFIETALHCIEKDGICVSICQMSVAISNLIPAVEIKKRLLEKHTLLAVFSMPDDLFHPVAGVNTCIIVFKAHSPHSKRKETFFGHYKDDGFLKSRNKGRVDIHDKWNKIKANWLYAYENNKNIAGLSVTQCVDANDEWCAEAYMETDYSKVTQADFEEAVKKYALFNLMNGEKHD